MSNPEELALAKLALTIGIDGCVDWDIKVVARLKAELGRHGLALETVRRDVIEYVRSGGDVIQVKETREGWKDRRDYWYKVIVPMPDLFAKGLFIELELVDTDPEHPEVKMVNAHEQV